MIARLEQKRRIVFRNRPYRHEYEYVEAVFYLNKDDLRRRDVSDSVRVEFDRSRSNYISRAFFLACGYWLMLINCLLIGHEILAEYLLSLDILDALPDVVSNAISRMVSSLSDALTSLLLKFNILPSVPLDQVWIKDKSHFWKYSENVLMKGLDLSSNPLSHRTFMRIITRTHAALKRYPSCGIGCLVFVDAVVKSVEILNGVEAKRFWNDGKRDSKSVFWGCWCYWLVFGNGTLEFEGFVRREIVEVLQGKYGDDL